jgi:site-specific recombinase XerD
MVEREQVKHNPVTKIKLPKIRHTPGLTLTTDEISRVLTIDTGSARCSIQAHLLFKTALRVSELVSLRWSEVNFAQGTITKKGKGGKTRTIHLSRAIFQQLDAYQACQRTWAATRPKVKAALSHPDTAFVLLSYRGQPITPSTVNKQLKRRATKAGVLLHDSHESRTNDCASKISAHAMRRSSATQMRRQKVDIADIATFLGHESIETTLRHYAFPDEDVQQHAVNTLDEIA